METSNGKQKTEAQMISLTVYRLLIVQMEIVRLLTETQMVIISLQTV
jgi:hypothetical protein